MKLLMIAATGLLLSCGAVAAASMTSTDTENSNNSHSRDTASPGTVGGMNRESAGVATGSEEIKRQQEGASLYGDAGARRDGNAKLTGQSPGTVGASPGYTADSAK